MSILITGGTGFLGSQLAKRLVKEGYNVVLLDVAPDFESVRDIVNKVKIVRGDFTIWAEISDVIKKYRVTDIFHLGAILTVTAESHPFLALRVNVYGTANVLEAARLFDVQKVIYTSSISTYGPGLPQLVNEETRQEPRTAYGITKLFGELWGLYYYHKYGIDFRVIRFPSLVGGNRLRTLERASAFATLMILEPALGRPCEVYVDEYTKIQILYYKDAINALMLLYNAKNPKSRVYNAGGILTDAQEIANTVRKYIPDAQIKFTPKFETRAMLSHRVLVSRKVQDELGWKMAYTLDDMVKDFISEVRNGLWGT